jgi:hypothetical protein
MASTARSIHRSGSALLRLLAAAGLAYVHVADHAAMGAPAVPAAFKQALRKTWPRTFFIGGSFDLASGQQAVDEGLVDLIGLGRAFLANPDLIERLKKGQALNAPDMGSFFTVDEGSQSLPHHQGNTMTNSASTATTAASTSTTLVAQIEERQAVLGITDHQLCEALGFDRTGVLALIKLGTMRMPLPKIPVLVVALGLDPAELLRLALTESSPELLELIEGVFGPLQLTTTERSLIKHLRKIAGDRPASPIVLDGKSIIALVTA